MTPINRSGSSQIKERLDNYLGLWPVMNEG